MHPFDKQNDNKMNQAGFDSGGDETKKNSMNKSTT